MAKSSNAGTCELCGHHDSESAMVRHLAQCAPDHDPQGRAAAVVTFQLEAEDDPRYWIHAEARASATLRQVDALLRRV